MKTFLLVVAAIMTTICMSQINVPSTVQSSFAKFFPGISVKKWDKEEEKYEANFTKDGKSMSAVFNTNGILEETETVIAAGKLPAPVISYVRKYYKEPKIKEAMIVLKSNGEKIYEAQIEGKDLVFDAKGNFLREEKEKKRVKKKIKEYIRFSFLLCRCTSFILNIPTVCFKRFFLCSPFCLHKHLNLYK